MFHFFKSKKQEDISAYPPFFQEYLRSFEPTDTSAPTRFVVFDTETTGFNYANDRILSIGAVDIIDNAIDLKHSFEIFLNQEKFNPEAVAIHGIRKEHQYAKYPEAQAIERFIQYIGNAILVGHHVGFDIKMINVALERSGLPPLRNKSLDTNDLFKKTKVINPLLRNDKNYSLDDICEELGITMHDRHNAAGDAYLTALAFLKLKSKIAHGKNKSFLYSLLRD